MQVRANPGPTHAGSVVQDWVHRLRDKEWVRKPWNAAAGKPLPPEGAKDEVEASAPSSTFLFQSPSLSPGQNEQQAGTGFPAASWQVGGGNSPQGGRGSRMGPRRPSLFQTRDIQKALETITSTSILFTDFLKTCLL